MGYCSSLISYCNRLSFTTRPVKTQLLHERAKRVHSTVIGTTRCDGQVAQRVLLQLCVPSTLPFTYDCDFARRLLLGPPQMRVSFPLRPIQPPPGPSRPLPR